MTTCLRDVRSYPESGHSLAPLECLLMRRLFDHLVGARKQRRRHSKAKGLSHLKIDHQLGFSRLDDRQVGGLRERL